jgi:2',3'-cyclic-nucleotide 2'-phosphodiesterase/3'-nucleotidase
MSKFLFNLNVVENYTQTPIGQITKSISSRESLFGPSEFVDLIQTAQLEITGADISFSEPLNYNSTIDSGWIRVGDLFKLYHYENYLYTMRLTGKEIKKYLEFSFGNWFNQMSDGSDNLLKFKNNDDGSIKYSLKTNLPELDEVFYNFSSAAGINYIVDVSKRVGKRVTITTLSNGTSFSPDSVYTVAVNSYRGNGGGGHLIRGAGIPKEELSERILSSTDKDLRYNIMKWIESKKIINPVIIGNWKIIPPEWWKKGKERDFELLFGSKPNYVKDKTNDSK